MLCVAHTPILSFYFSYLYGGKHRVKRVEAFRPVAVMILTNGEQMGNKWRAVRRSHRPPNIASFGILRRRELLSIGGQVARWAFVIQNAFCNLTFLWVTVVTLSAISSASGTGRKPAVVKQWHILQYVL